jgi:hypothetical protein
MYYYMSDRDITKIQHYTIDNIILDCNWRRPPHFCCAVRGLQPCDLRSTICTRRDLTLFHMMNPRTNNGILNS